jgi:CheY-like chemotaxis protein
MRANRSSIDGAAPPEVLRVLVVDDNRDVLNSTVDLLERACWRDTDLLERGCSCDVRGCDNAAACLSIVEVWRPNLLLLDIAMPSASGIEVLGFLCAGQMKPPLVVAVTAYCNARVRQDVAATHFDYYEMKPVRLTRLKELVAEAAARTHALSADCYAD